MSRRGGALTSAVVPTTPEAGPVIWLRADTGVTLVGAKVSDWANLVTSANFASVAQAVDADRPTFVSSSIGGRQALDFDGASQFLRRATFTAPLVQPSTVFVVFNADTVIPLTNVSIVDGGLVGARNALGAIGADANITAGVPLIAVGALAAATPTIAGALFKGATSELWFNGASIAAGAAGAQSLDGLTLGALFDGSANFFDGQIAEVIVFNQELSTASRVGVQRLLGARYGITVP